LFLPSILVDVEASVQKSFVVLSILIVFFVGVAIIYNNTVGFAFSVGSKEAALENVKAYAKDMDIKVLGATCAETDSDRNGYISCEARVIEFGKTDATEKLLECGSGALFSRTGGCKLRVGAYPMQPFHSPQVPTPEPAPKQR
jgi:hypothetical protein